MGIFDDIFKQSENPATKFTATNENGATVALLVASINADGNPSQAEIDSVLRILLFKKWFIRDEIMPYYKKAFFALQTGSLKEVIDGSVGLISDGRRLTVFALCCEVFFADGFFKEKEKEIAEYIATTLGIETNNAQKIMEVMVLKNVDNREFTD